MVPSLLTSGAIKYTAPPALMSPKFLTLLVEFAEPVKLAAPFMKSLLLTSSVVASKPFTLTLAVPLKTIPAGLIRNRLPFACNAPEIWVTELPLILFSVTALLPALWINLTSSF